MRLILLAPAVLLAACSVDNDSPEGNEITIGYDEERAANIADDVGAIVEDAADDVQQEVAEEANEAEVEMDQEADQIDNQM